MTRRAVDSLTWRGQDLSPYLAALDDPGWTTIPCDPEHVAELRRLVRQLERGEGWYIRTDYDAPLGQLSVARSKPI